eukprot:Protomagalhaensia_sp_Gyna_25__3791@NODE_3406_length_588_cov_4_542805_g2860_i0_p1_GENE_NODE_3406_length_588_cov_4_542805_g2860_i0NODE_3406_length_588_cov_4_542805_g2860_i0_p1_ORF_typecomplete_len171_score19_57Flavoprotein/PF02441_19/1_9e28_NODE_3406_length_588_cov_4_542805_g2860_i035514
MAKQLAIQYAESSTERSFAETWQTEEDITVCEHIQAMKWADVGVLLPMSANTLAKITAGICDNYILSIIRAWPFTEQGRIAKPLLAFPAMNTNMWLHPVSKDSIRKLEDWGWNVSPPIVKKLACGDIGVGALPAITDVVDAIISAVRGNIHIGDGDSVP